MSYPLLLPFLYLAWYVLQRRVVFAFPNESWCHFGISLLPSAQYQSMWSTLPIGQMWDRKVILLITWGKSGVSSRKANRSLKGNKDEMLHYFAEQRLASIIQINAQECIWLYQIGWLRPLSVGCSWNGDLQIQPPGPSTNSSSWTGQNKPAGSPPAGWWCTLPACQTLSAS